MSAKSAWLAAVSAAVLAWPGAAQVTGSRVNPGAQPGDRPAEQQSQADPAGQPAEAEANAQVEAEAAVEADADAAGAQAEGAGQITAASAGDFRPGVQVLDTEGELVGTVESVEADGAVVATGNVRAKLPFRSFGKNDRGLVISLTRAELEAAAAAQSPS